MSLEHGGNIAAAAARYNIPAQQWIDLSTGISPWVYPVYDVPASVWRDLPQADGELEQAAAHYYRCGQDAVLAVPGSQFALQALPALLPRGRVAMPLRGYAEHRLAWSRAGHSITDYIDGVELKQLLSAGAVDHVVLINPNNPTGEQLPREEVLDLLRTVSGGGGYLVVDEAFADVCPEISLASQCPREGLVVYRSLGKFFGLAGLRLGFMLATPALCRALAATMTPWMVSHPARWVGSQALGDTPWQQAQRERLMNHSENWLHVLSHTLPGLELSATPLFVSGTGESDFCGALYRALAGRGVLVRLFDEVNGHSMLRFGLSLPEKQARLQSLIDDSLEECACGIA